MSSSFKKGPLKSGRSSRLDPAALHDLGRNGCAASCRHTTSETSNAAADRITAPTFSGSWKGMKSVQPSAPCPGAVQAGMEGSSISRSGDFVPKMSSSSNSLESIRYQVKCSGIPVGGASPPVLLIHPAHRSGWHDIVSFTTRFPDINAISAFLMPRAVRSFLNVVKVLFDELEMSFVLPSKPSGAGALWVRIERKTRSLLRWGVCKMVYGSSLTSSKSPLSSSHATAVSSSQAGPFMKIANPPGSRNVLILLSVSCAFSRARVITPATGRSNLSSILRASTSMFSSSRRSTASSRNAARFFLPSAMMMKSSGLMILRGIAGNPAPLPISRSGEGRSMRFATIMEST